MTDYISKHKPEWEELAALVRKARKRGNRLKHMSPVELSRLDILYRRATITLSQVATRTRDTALIQYLNELVASAHVLIYLPAKKTMKEKTWLFFSCTFPQMLARTWRYHVFSAMLMIAGLIVGYVATVTDVEASYVLLPANETRQSGATREQLIEVLRGGRDMDSGSKFMFASFLFSHNLKVGILALTTGILACVPTIFLMGYNGMILGAFTAVHHQKGIVAEYWAWILPHGVTELGAIVLCGGVGLILGTALLCPGLMKRSESLRRAGRQAALITLGVACMLVLAAIIESYLRQSHLPTYARLVFAFGTVLFWIAYIIRGFRLNAAER